MEVENAEGIPEGYRSGTPFTSPRVTDVGLIGVDYSVSEEI